jgi:hypothetical protein
MFLRLDPPCASGDASKPGLDPLPSFATIIGANHMQITFSLSLRDYMAGQALHAKRSEMAFLGYCMARYFYPFMGICFLVFEFTPHHSVGSQPSKTLSVIFALILCLIPVYVHFMTRRAYFRSRTRSDECAIDFSSELIRTSGSNIKSEVNWSVIQSFNEDGKAIVLYLAPARFLIIPKRVCTSSQIEELRGLISKNVQQSPVLH